MENYIYPSGLSKRVLILAKREGNVGDIKNVSMLTLNSYEEFDILEDMGDSKEIPDKYKPPESL